jgi:hypothetical protein
VGAVGGHQGGPVAERGESIASGVDEVALDVHGEHVSLAEPVGQQGGVVPGAGADLQDVVPVADVEGFEHAGHQPRGAGGGQADYRGAPRTGFLADHGEQGAVRIDPLLPLRVGVLAAQPLPGGRVLLVEDGHQLVTGDGAYRGDPLA